MISKVDPIKSRIVLHYLAKAVKKEKDRETAQKKLKIQLKQLKKISTNSLQKHLKELENRIVDTVRIEKQILSTQDREDVFHQQLKERIKQLEGKLGKYVETKAVRERRIEELEAKYDETKAEKSEEILDIKETVRKLEKIYDDAVKSKLYKKAELTKIKKRINKLKNKV